MKGLKFGRLTVLQFAGINVHRKRLWKCLCECGAMVVVVGSSLRSGNTLSCGCLHKDKISTHRQSGSGNTSRSQEYRAWMGIIQRCCNENDPDYSRYGGRGITVCLQWRESFENFLKDMGPKPSSKHSIDRKNNDGNYEPGNCRWATRSEQDRNKSTNRTLTYRGETRCLTDWAELLGMSPLTLSARIVTLGWSIEKALETPVRSRHQ